MVADITEMADGGGSGGGGGGIRTPSAEATTLQAAEQPVAQLHLGVNEGNRTLNDRIHNPALCQLSYIHRARRRTRTFGLPDVNRLLSR